MDKWLRQCQIMLLRHVADLNNQIYAQRSTEKCYVLSLSAAAWEVQTTRFVRRAKGLEAFLRDNCRNFQ